MRSGTTRERTLIIVDATSYAPQAVPARRDHRRELQVRRSRPARRQSDDVRARQRQSRTPRSRFKIASCSQTFEPASRRSASAVRARMRAWLTSRYPAGKFSFDPAPHARHARRLHQRRSPSAPAALRRGGRRPDRRAARNAVPAGRLDRASGRPSRARQPHERVHPLQAGADRRQPDHQAVRRRRPGRASRTPRARRSTRRWRCSTRCTGAGWCCWNRCSEADFARPLSHPERGPITLDWMLQLYAWHGRHHVAHITTLRAAGRVVR